MNNIQQLKQEITDKVKDIYPLAFRATAQERTCIIIDNNMYKNDMWWKDKPLQQKQHETFCGTITDCLQKEFRENGFTKTKQIAGYYNGNGMDLSEDNPTSRGLEHIWLLLEIDKTKFIIDGSFGQFMPRQNIRSLYDRIKVFHESDPEYTKNYIEIRECHNGCWDY